MPSLAELTDAYPPAQQATLADMTESANRPRVIINTNAPSADSVNATAGNSDTGSTTDSSTASMIMDRLLGLNGQERYQLWPEKMVREGVSAAHDAMTQGTVAPGLRREDFTDAPAPDAPTNHSTALGKMLGVAPVAWSPQDKIVEQAQAMSALAGTGGLGGVGNEAGTALGASPVARSLLSDSSKPGSAIEAMAQTNKPMKVYRGEYSGNKNGKYWTEDKEFARQFTQSGQEHEVMQKHIDAAHVYKPNEEIYAGDPDAIDKVVAEAKAKGFKAVQLSEGLNQPNSIYVFNKGALKSDNEAGAAIQSVAAAKPFYSPVENAIANSKQAKATPEQWLGFLKNQPGVKQEELSHLGLDKLQGPITKEQLIKAVQEGQPQIKEVVKGDQNPYPHTNSDQWESAITKAEKAKDFDEVDRLNQAWEHSQGVGAGQDATKYNKYQLPGGSNYKETLLTLPEGLSKSSKAEVENVSQLAYNKKYDELTKSQQENAERLAMVNSKKDEYKSSHWDEPNVLAHIRTNDRDINGKKSLHVEEVQSDWHQAGRKQGYADNVAKDAAEKKYNDAYKAVEDARENFRKPENWDKDFNKVLDPLIKERDLASAELNSHRLSKVPDAPFKKTWDELALKHVLNRAVKEGYDSISWTPGEAQAARYDLSKQVNLVSGMKQPNGKYLTYIEGKDERPLFRNQNGFSENGQKELTPQELEATVGKEAAEKIINGKPNKDGWIDLRDKDLKVGGEGMKAFYDKMLVDKANSLSKKYGGGKVEKSENLESAAKSLKDFEAQFKSKPIPADKKEEWNRLRDNVANAKNSVHILHLTPEFKANVKAKGFPLFSSAPIFTPVQGNPFETKDKK